MSDDREAPVSLSYVSALPGRQPRRSLLIILPLLTSLVLLVPTLFYWGHERSVLAEFGQSRVSQFQVRLAKRIQTEIDSQLRPLRRLANETAAGDVTSSKAFEDSAQSISREETTLKYIAWLDAQGNCISSFPEAAKTSISEELFGAGESDPHALFARLSSAPDGLLLTIAAGGPRRASDRLIVLPIMHPAADGLAQVGGAIVTCETTLAMRGALIPPDASAPVIVEVKDERGEVLFASDGATAPEAQRLLRAAEVEPLKVLNQSWSMSVAAAPPGLGQRPSSDAGALLITGVIVSLLGGATVAQAGRHRRREQKRAADHLATLESLLLQQQRLNQQIRQDADAKAMLLRELNHRVKNNLAGIVGLLSAGVPELSEQAQEWLDRAIARIETLARAHELFVGTASELGLADLVSKTLAPIWAIKPAEVQITLDLSAVNDPLSTDQAVTLAMVIHELASNALQHGLGDHGKLCVRASRTRPGWVIIEVIDDGTSTQESNEMEPIRSADDAPATATLARGIRTGIGLQLVRGLVGRELHGTFSLREKPDGGTIATVEFPIGAQPAQC